MAFAQSGSSSVSACGFREPSVIAESTLLSGTGVTSQRSRQWESTKGENLDRRARARSSKGEVCLAARRWQRQSVEDDELEMVSTRW